MTCHRLIRARITGMILATSALLTACGGSGGGVPAAPDPAPPPGPAAFSATSVVATGYAHVVSLTSTGAVRTWGANDDGQLGNGSQEASLQPVRVVGLPASPAAVAVAAGSTHSLALLANGSVWGWGEATGGALGSTAAQRTCSVHVPDSITCVLSATPVNGISDATAVAAGYAYSVALRADGSVWAWGVNDSGQLGDAGRSGDQSAVPVRAGVLSGVVAVSAGGAHVLALMSDGTVWAWGANGQGQLGLGHTRAVSTPTQVPGQTGITMVRAGYAHSLALKTDGSVWAWGDNSTGALGNPAARENCIPFYPNFICSTIPVQALGVSQGAFLVAGNGYSMVLQPDRRFWAFGLNGIPLVDAGNAASTCHLDRSIDVPCLRTPVLSNVALGSASSSNPSLARYVVAGQSTVHFRTADGADWAWGFGSKGALGNGSAAYSAQPVRALD